MRASARPSAGQTALLLSKIEDEEETGRAIARKSEKSVALPVDLVRAGIFPGAAMADLAESGHAIAEMMKTPGVAPLKG
jgi:hypothetical protein